MAAGPQSCQAVAGPLHRCPSTCGEGAAIPSDNSLGRNLEEIAEGEPVGGPERTASMRIREL
eukprot:8296564-Pyramimonas_sp.AAC.1